MTKLELVAELHANHTRWRIYKSQLKQNQKLIHHCYMN